MTDPLRTLDEATGLARTWTVLPPEAPDGFLWRVLVDIGVLGPGDTGRTVEDYPLHLVGAYDVTRRGAFQRGAGEAVERYALMPRPGTGTGTDTDTGADAGPDRTGLRHARPDAPALRFTEPGAALAHRGALDTELDWYRGTRLADSSAVLVPAPLVDYTGSDAADQAAGRPGLFDPSPSGAASGAGIEQATRAALLEIVERDAVIAAWAAQLALPAVDIDEVLAAAPADPRWRALRTLLAGVRAAGLEPVFARIPTFSPEVTCVVCVLVDRGAEGQLGAVGAKASGSGARALLASLQEALQIRELLTRMRRLLPVPAELPDVVRHDVDRAWFWTGAAAVDALERWTAGFERSPWAVPERDPDTSALVAGMVADGADPVVVPLTQRLPAAVRELGWAAVKVVCPGYQPLRMDERHTFGWHEERIRTAAARTGCRATAPGGEVFGLAHPLI
ncbi:YcaO-like family protein [Kitasatospora sp. NPDC101155]|uniref:YcaO-like family protein n=1 Tax=Kitasatospora sp. NPDC101155 TaxID=3364097 RepID=UPI003804E7EB